MGLDSSRFHQGQKQTSEDLKKTKENANAAAKQIEESGRRAAQFFQKLKIEALGLFAVFTAGRGITDFVRDITSGDAAIGRMAKNLGISTEALATWQNAAERSGGSAAGIAADMQNLQGEITKLQTTGQGGEFIAWLDQLHVGLTKANGDYKTVAELYDDISKSKQWQTLSPQQQLLYGSRLGMSAGTVQTVRQSPEWLAKTAAEAQARGLPSAEDAARAQEFERKIKNLQDAVYGLGRTILNDLYEPLTKVMDQFDHFLQTPETKAAIAEYTNKVKNFGIYIMQNLPEWEAAIGRVWTQINHVVEALGGWTNVAEVFFGAWAITKFVPLLGVLSSIAGIVKTVTVGMTGLIGLVTGPLGLAATAALALYEGFHISGAGEGEDDAVNKMKRDGRLPVSPVQDRSLSENQRAFLDTLAGPESGGDYTVLNGGKEHTHDFSHHPNRVGEGGTSTAFGRYQFTYGTWQEQAAKLGLHDISPVNQDRAAWDYAATVYRKNAQRDLEGDLREGGHEGQIADALKAVWPSMPGGSQSNRNLAGFKASLSENLTAERSRLPIDPSLNPSAANRYGSTTSTTNAPTDNSTHIQVDRLEVHTPSDKPGDVAKGVKTSLMNLQFGAQMNRGLA